MRLKTLPNHQVQTEKITSTPISIPVHHALGIYTFKFAFPDSPHIPSKIDQSFLFRSISFHISLKLRFPIFDIRFRHRGVATWTTMPEAPMNEYRNFSPGIADVGTAYVSSIRVIDPPMNPVSGEARIPKHPTNSQLWLRIPAPIALHRLPHCRRRSRGGHATHVDCTWNMHITVSNWVRPSFSCTWPPSIRLWMTSP